MIKNIKHNLQRLSIRIQMAITNRKAEGFVDSGVKILIAVVIGALLLTGLYVLFGDMIIPNIKMRIQDLFNYAG